MWSNDNGLNPLSKRNCCVTILTRYGDCSNTHFCIKKQRVFITIKTTPHTAEYN